MRLPGWAAPALVGAVALCVGGVGLGARDLTGDEIAMLTGGPADILFKSLHPNAVFTGHLPFSYLARWLSLGVLDPTSALAWRLPALVGAVVAAGVTAAAPRGGWLAGMLVALSPVVSFHAQDSSNYAWTAAAGALVVVGLARPDRRGWLAIGLLLAVVNDLYSLWLVAGAGLGTLLLARGTGRAILWRWAPAVAVGLPVAAGVWAQLSGGAVGLHADPAPLDLGLGALTLGRLHRFVGAAVHGYAAGRGAAFWELGPAVVTLGALLVANLRDRRARGVCAVWAGGLLAASAAGGLVWFWADRVLPVEPRSMISLIPAFSVGLSAAVGRLPRGARGVAAGLLLLLVGGATLQQSLDRSTMHRDVAAWVAAAWAPGEVVVAEDRLRWRLRAAGLPAAALRPCVVGLAAAPATWWLRVQPLDRPLSVAGCAEGDGTTRPVSLGGWHVTRSFTAGPPAHERNAASFLMPVVGVRYAADPPTAAPTQPRLQVERALLDGVHGGALVVQRGQDPPRWLSMEGAAADLPPDLPLDGLVEARVRPPLPPNLPDWRLLDPLRRDVQQWEPLVLAPTLIDARFSLPAASLRHPAWQVLRRLLAALLAVLLVWSAARRDPA